MTVFIPPLFVSADFTYVIVVCTKNRPTEIREFRKNLIGQVSKSLKEVIVVEGSDQTIDFANNDQRNDISVTHFNWTLLQTSKGKPSALNLALDYLASREEKFAAIVFIDDDIHFALSELEKGICFLLENNLCGLSPLVINEDDVCSLNNSDLQQKIRFQKEGKLSPNGENYWINQRNIQREWVMTDWIPGGTSIFNWEKIRRLRFSSVLENPILDGYALGDDVDFSARASEFGQIGCLTTIQVIHSSPKSANRDFFKIVQARGRWKAFLLRQFPTRISFVRVIVFESTRALWHLLNKRKFSRAYREIYVFLREFLRHLG